MASPSGAKSRQSATSFPSRGYSSSRSAFASSSTAFMSRPSSTKPVTMYRKSSSSSTSAVALTASPVSSVRFQVDQGSASPSRSISVQKNRDRNTNAVPSSKKKVCMCSPTNHPGSFRCSLHKNSRCSVNVSNGSQIQNGSLNIRRSAMRNSVVRIGSVEGVNLVKRALSALIRPSSNQQRQRSAFQVRPSRLSVMSKAEEEPMDMVIRFD